MPVYIPPLPDPDVVRILKNYRTALDAKEVALMEEMGRRWLNIENRLEADIAALAFETIRRMEIGETVTEQMVWRMERYKILQEQMKFEINQYNKDYAVGAISLGQEQNAILGITAAEEAITTSIGKPLAAFNRINLGAIESIIGFAGDGSPLNNLLKNDYADASEGLLSALMNGLARGQNPLQTARDMTAGMEMGLERALLIARTETARAYRTGSTEQYRKYGVVSGFKRLVKKETACMACLVLDGEMIEPGEELTDHPNGKCIVVPIVAGVAPPDWQTGKEFFESLSPEEQAARMGAGKFQLWQEGAFRLEDLAQVAHSDVWGNTPRVATIEELTTDAVRLPIIDFSKPQEVSLGTSKDLRYLFREEESHREYLRPLETKFSTYSYEHIIDKHKDRIEWIEKNTKVISRAIIDPVIIEKTLRVKRGDHLRFTYVGRINEKKYAVVAVNLANLPGEIQSDYHQVVTVYPAPRSDFYSKNGELKDRWKSAK